MHMDVQEAQRNVCLWVTVLVHPVKSVDSGVEKTLYLLRHKCKICSASVVDCGGCQSVERNASSITLAMPSCPPVYRLLAKQPPGKGNFLLPVQEGVSQRIQVHLMIFPLN